MTFQIRALPEDQFAHLPSLSDADLAAQNIQKRLVDAQPGYPCRVSLQDAEIGETIFLLNHCHHDEETPYRSCHAIFVRAGAEQALPDVGEVPASLTLRLISIRAFDTAHDMVAADVVEGRELNTAIPAMLAQSGVAYLHLHNAKPGCYAARVDPVR
ncbi:DUF1203 domain-containing protein [Hyphomonas sp.]|uniref:DUF1203 domain-containing protein n=1 Tax=Hyphomonas sp. TaxID=87 RepID=UPI0025C03A8A|nr:DUF1203 domain-containing protein [Hyphomonas sp.]